jgi:hypothetical protein
MCSNLNFKDFGLIVIHVSDTKSRGQPACHCHEEQMRQRNEDVNVYMNVMYKYEDMNVGMNVMCNINVCHCLIL